MDKILKYLFPLFLIMFLAAISACKQNSTVSSYYDNNSTTGAGDNNSNGTCGCGCCGCCNTTPTCDTTITILDEQGNPAQNATVTVYGTTTHVYTTDENGQVFATQLTDGEYIIKVVMTGYQEKLDLFTVQDNECPVVALALEPTPPAPTCNGVFTIQEGVKPNLPITTADMTINGQTYVANSSGIITVPGLSNGTYPYTVTAAGYDTVTGVYTVANDNCPDISPIQPACLVTDLTFVIRYNGVVVPFKTVTFIFDGNTTYPTTDVNGEIVISNVTAGSHTYSVSYTM